MSLPVRRLFCLALCAPVAAVAVWTGASVQGGAPAAAKEQTGSMYRMSNAWDRLLPMNPRTLADLRSVPLLRLTAKKQASPPQLVWRSDGQAAAVLFYTGDGSRPQDLTIRILDLRTGGQSGKAFHLPVRAPVWIEGISTDGSMLYALRSDRSYVSPTMPPTQLLQRTVYYVLSARTGRVLHTAHIVHSCCGSEIFDAAHQRLYTLVTWYYADRKSPAQAPSLMVTDLQSGKQLARIPLPGLHAGSSKTGRVIQGEPLVKAWSPAMALSADGAHLALVDPSSDKLTLVDTNRMQVTRSLALHAPRGLLDRLGSFLGLLPETADAKGFEGVQMQGWYSPDGHLLYVTGTRGSVTTSHQFKWTQLGLRVIDVSSGTVLAKRFEGKTLVGTDVAPNGWVYVSTPESGGTGAFGCPCTLQRLNPTTLATETERHHMGTYNSYPSLFFLVARPR